LSRGSAKSELSPGLGVFYACHCAHIVSIHNTLIYSLSTISTGGIAMRTFRTVAGISMLFSILVFTGCTTEEKVEYRTTSVPTNQYDRLVLSDISWNWDEAKKDLTVQGKVKNNGTVSITDVEISMKAYASGTLVSNHYITVSPYTLSANTQVDWKITGWDCPKPDSVSVGYSYNTEITVPAQKRIF
jgi:hypothetical protein